jgi:hypothetical protein
MELQVVAVMVMELQVMAVMARGLHVAAVMVMDGSDGEGFAGVAV